MAKMKAMFHVNDNERWEIALGNITNLLKNVGEENVEIVVIANGPSVSAFIDQEKIEKMQELAQKGTRFLACKNSLNKMCSDGVICINEESLPDFIRVIPAGITEIIKSQQEGYAYIKP